jgi:oligoribonuclease
MDHSITLLWIDLEMTGLDPERDVILEIASIVTDDNLQVLHEGPSLVIHHDDAVLAHISKEVKELFSKSDLIERVKQSSTTLEDAQAQTVAFIKQYCSNDELPPLCGNSVWQDRVFLARYMPQVLELLHYRMVDVSTIKELVNRWYPNDPDVQFNKADTHRALADIRESIAELKQYRRCFFV